MDRRGRVGPTIARTAPALVLIYVASVGAVYLRPHDGNVATWWPAAGVSAVLLLATPRRHLPLVALLSAAAAGLAIHAAGRPLGLSLMLGLSNALESLGVLYVLHRLSQDGQERLEGPEDFGRLFAACAAGVVVLGTCVGLCIGLTGAGPGLDAARTTTTSHLASNLLVLPLLLLWRQRPRFTGIPAEAVLQLSLVALTVSLAFAHHQRLALVFLPLPLLVWAGLRMGAFMVSVELLLVAASSTVLTARGFGPFAAGPTGAGLSDTVSGWLVQGFLVCAVLVTLPPCLAMAQRSQLLLRMANERRLNDITLDTTAAIIIVTDPVGTVLRANATLERLTGHAPDALVGLPLWRTALIPPERRGIVKNMYSDDTASRIPGTREADIVTSGGDRRLVVWTNQVVRDARGRTLYAVLTATDVTNERTQSGMVAHVLEATLSTAIIGLDVDGQVTVFNRGAEELLGYQLEEVFGTSLTSLVASAQPSHYLLRGTDPETGDWSWHTRRGRVLTMSTTISRVHNVVGKHIGYMCIGRDVTEQRRTQEMLVRALDKERQGMERLRQLDAAKDEFISTVSHELRTPTTSIVGYTEMLLEGEVGDPSDDQVPMLEAIARNGQRLIAVASDLLTLAELESDSATDWQREDVDLTGMVLHAEEAILSLVARRELSVHFEVPAERIAVIGDAAHLDRVLINLLSNAVKFTPDGGSVSCRLAVADGHARLEVSDTGIGIPEEEQGDLFTKFFRSSNAQHAAIQGTGLGLSIIDQIVTAHGGDISVRSAEGQGTTFTVRLPLTGSGVTPLPTAHTLAVSADDCVA